MAKRLGGSARHASEGAEHAVVPLIHWVLEAARLDARELPPQAQEVGLTLLFLRAFQVWRNYASPDQQRTRVFLRRNLGWLDRLPRRPVRG